MARALVTVVTSSPGGVPLGGIMDRKLVEGIIRVRIIMSPYTFLPTILLWVTPSAKRNSYRVAAADKIHNKRDQQRTPPQSSHEGK